MDGYRFDKLTTLVVDDNDHMRKLVATILQAFGVGQVFEADNGQRAWAMLSDVQPDLVFVDWQMDGMNGLELTKLIRTSSQSPNPLVPIIMLTGHTHFDQVRRARDVGVTEFMAKPVSVRAMMSRLVAVIEHPRPFVRTKNYFGPCRRHRATIEYRGPERRAGEFASSKLQLAV